MKNVYQIIKTLYHLVDNNNFRFLFCENQKTDIHTMNYSMIILPTIIIGSYL